MKEIDDEFLMWGIPAVILISTTLFIEAIRLICNRLSIIVLYDELFIIWACITLISLIVGYFIVGRIMHGHPAADLKFTIDMLAHTDLGNSCCGVFADYENGRLYCNECGVEMTMEVIKALKP